MSHKTSTIQLTAVSLSKIVHSPFQARHEYTHVVELAESIATEGLLVPPAARKIENGKLELLFGNTRFEAFILLNQIAQVKTKTGKFPDEDKHEKLYGAIVPLSLWEMVEFKSTEWKEMHLEIRDDIDDEKAFDLGLLENLQRKDLSPLEEGLAMRSAIERGRTRKEIAVLFGKSDSAIRNILRTMDLPPALLEQYGMGQLPQSAARSLVMLLPALHSEQIEAIGMKVADASDSSVQARRRTLLYQLQGIKTVAELWGEYTTGYNGDPRAGSKYAWKLESKFPRTIVPKNLSLDDRVTRVLKISSPIKLKDMLADCFEKAEFEFSSTKELNAFTKDVVASVLESEDRPSDKAELVTWAQTVADDYNITAVLVLQIIRLGYPQGSCNDCSFHLTSEKMHYCTLKPCLTERHQIANTAAARKWGTENGIELRTKEEARSRGRWYRVESWPMYNKPNFRKISEKLMKTKKGKKGLRLVVTTGITNNEAGITESSKFSMMVDANFPQAAKLIAEYDKDNDVFTEETYPSESFAYWVSHFSEFLTSSVVIPQLLGLNPLKAADVGFALLVSEQIEAGADSIGGVKKVNLNKLIDQEEFDAWMAQKLHEIVATYSTDVMQATEAAIEQTQKMEARRELAIEILKAHFNLLYNSNIWKAIGWKVNPVFDEQVLIDFWTCNHVRIDEKYTRWNGANFIFPVSTETDEEQAE